MLSLDQLGSNTKSSRGNKIGTLESMLSGVASGLIAIPKGFFSLGASIMDLGFSSSVLIWSISEFSAAFESTFDGVIFVLCLEGINWL